jgi:hydrogenase maturation protein HypF
MIARGLNAPLTSSCGRLFDAVAALAGVRQRVSYEGQAALELEMAIEEGDEAGAYPFALRQLEELLVVDPAPMLRALVAELQQGAGPGRVSARFHNGLAEAIGQVCALLRRQQEVNLVALSGGVFQNRYLTERTLEVLGALGFTVLTHALVPPNDGGLALGQAVIAGAGGGVR